VRVPVASATEAGRYESIVSQQHSAFRNPHSAFLLDAQRLFCL